MGFDFQNNIDVANEIIEVNKISVRIHYVNNNIFYFRYEKLLSLITILKEFNIIGNLIEIKSLQPIISKIEYLGNRDQPKYINKTLNYLNDPKKLDKNCNLHEFVIEYNLNCYGSSYLNNYITKIYDVINNILNISFSQIKISKMEFINLETLPFYQFDLNEILKSNYAACPDMSISILNFHIRHFINCKEYIPYSIYLNNCIIDKMEYCDNYTNKLMLKDTTIAKYIISS